MRYGRKGKLSPGYIGPYEILQRVGEVDYELVAYGASLCPSSLLWLYVEEVPR